MACAAAPARGSSIDRFHEFSLLGLLTSGYLALAGSGYLDTPALVLTSAALLLRLAMAAGWLRLDLPAGLLAVAALGYVAVYAVDYLFLSRAFLPATVHLILFLAAAKLLSAGGPRDFAWLKVIAMLEILSATVLSSGFGFFFFLALFLLFAVATFSSGEIRRSAGHGRLVRSGMRGFPRRLVLLILWLSLAVLVLTLGMFFVLPRTARAALQSFASGGHIVAGFANEVALGKTGTLAIKNTPVMHVRINDGSSATGLKWRGTALAEFDGRRWFNSGSSAQAIRADRRLLLLDRAGRPWRNGRRITYDVELRSLDSDTLYLTGVPESVQVNSPLLLHTPVDSYRLGVGPIDGLRYTAGSFLDESGSVGGPTELTAAERFRYLKLPPVDGRIRPLAESFAAGAATDLERARGIESHLRHHYGYTLELLNRPVRDPLAHFLFERRMGHCEYFASAMAVMLRTLGIPSRVATGFESGVYNSLSGKQLIRLSDAHSWVEAFVAGQGWTTFDPTPPDPGSDALSLWARVALYTDAAQTFWEEWVMRYDFDRQLSLILRVEHAGRALRFVWFERLTRRAAGSGAGLLLALKLYWKVVFATLALVILGWFGALRAIRALLARRRVERLLRGQASASDATLLYRKMLRLLGARGFAKPAWLTPAEFAAGLPESETGLLARELTVAYNDLRFGGERRAAPRMLELLARLERSR